MYTTMQNYKCIAWQDDDTVTESSYFVQKLVLFGKLRKMSFGRLCSNTRLLSTKYEAKNGVLPQCDDMCKCQGTCNKHVKRFSPFDRTLQYYYNLKP